MPISLDYHKIKYSTLQLIQGDMDEIHITKSIKIKVIFMTLKFFNL